MPGYRRLNRIRQTNASRRGDKWCRHRSMGNSAARNGGVLSELDSVPEVWRLNDLLAVSEAEACGALAAWRERSHRRDRNGGSMGHGLDIILTRKRFFALRLRLGRF
jgi:hypothetical protein